MELRGGWNLPDALYISIWVVFADYEKNEQFIKNLRQNGTEIHQKSFPNLRKIITRIWNQEIGDGKLENGDWDPEVEDLKQEIGTWMPGSGAPGPGSGSLSGQVPVPEGAFPGKPEGPVGLIYC